MGYYSDFNILIRGGKEPDRTAALSHLSVLSGEDIDRDYVDDGERVGGEVWDTKWYDIAQHLREASADFPGLMFEVFATGEDGKRSVHRACNGRYEHVLAVVTFPKSELEGWI